MTARKYNRALSIAGFDGSGGAGIQADLKTFSALGCYGMTVLTALPVQNTTGVKAVYDISHQCVQEQLHAVLGDIGADVIKIGMVHRPEIVHVIADALEQYAQVPIVLDPVMVAKSGDNLLTAETIEVLKNRLFPLAQIITPNLPEASVLLGRDILTKADMEQAACELSKLGPKAVVVKGGHLVTGPCDDCLYIQLPELQITWVSSVRIDTKNTHGTGCTFSAAIAAYLARGFGLADSVMQAKHYISGCIAAGAQFSIGQGNGPVHHFFNQGDFDEGDENHPIT